jgi:hypothetical protein
VTGNGLLGCAAEGRGEHCAELCLGCAAEGRGEHCAELCLGCAAEGRDEHCAELCWDVQQREGASIVLNRASGATATIILNYV